MDPAEQFDTGDHDLCRPEPLESQHWTDAKFHATVVVLDVMVGEPSSTFPDKTHADDATADSGLWASDAAGAGTGAPAAAGATMVVSAPDVSAPEAPAPQRH